MSEQCKSCGGDCGRPNGSCGRLDASKPPVCKFCEKAPADAGHKYCAACRKFGDNAIAEIFGGHGALDAAVARAFAKANFKRTR